MTRPTSFGHAVKNVSALNDVHAIDVLESSVVAVQVKNVGTAATAAGVLNFEASINSTDGINGDWFPVNAVQSIGSSIATSRAAASLAAGVAEAFAWKVSVSAFRWFRVRVSTAFTALSIAQVTLLASDVDVEFAPAIPSHGISGTVTTSPISPTTTNSEAGATTNLTSLVAAAATLLELSVYNPTAAIVYLKLYNKASAPVVASDIPVLVVPVPINGLVALNFGALGKRFSTGIAYGIVGGPTKTDATAVAAGVILSTTRI